MCARPAACRRRRTSRRARKIFRRSVPALQRVRPSCSFPLHPKPLCMQGATACVVGRLSGGTSAPLQPQPRANESQHATHRPTRQGPKDPACSGQTLRSRIPPQIVAALPPTRAPRVNNGLPETTPNSGHIQPPSPSTLGSNLARERPP